MTNFFSLVKVQLLSLFGVNKLLKSKNKKSKFSIGGIALLLLFLAGVIIVFGYFYADIFAKSLIMTGKGEQLIPLMLAISCIVCFLFSFYALGNTLFGFKDYDALMSMPIKPIVIILAKFIVVYLTNLLFTLFIVAPSLFIYNDLINLISLFQVVSVLVMCLVAPLLPIAISTLIGVVVYYISSRFRRKNFVQIIILVIFMLAVFALSFLSSMLESEDSALIVNSLGIVAKIYFLLPWAINAFSQSLWLLLFIAINLASIAIIFTFVCIFYKKLNTIFTSKRTIRNYKLKQYQSNSVNKALFKRELKRLFSCPVYFINSLFGLLMSLIISIGYAVLVSIYDLNSDPMAQAVFGVINRMIPALFGFMFLMAPTTCCSISLEGQSFWIIKTSPVSYKKVLNSKLSVHALFSVSVAFISSLIIGIFSNFGVLGTILLVVCALGISSFGGIFGLLANLKFPNLKWENVNVPVKQSLPCFFTIILALVVSILVVVMGIYVNVSLELLLAIYSIFFVVGSLVLYVLLCKYGAKMFNKLS